jgi:large subunit ribosomal protein L15
MDLSTVHQGVKRLRLKKRKGRGIGSGQGKTAGRGHKGQFTRSGANMPKPLYEGGQMPLVRKMPKRGFNNARFHNFFHVINVGDLDAHFADGATVDTESLRKAGLANGPSDGVKILGEGELTKKLTVKAHRFSKSAAEKITAKGGAAEILAGPKPPKKGKMKPRPPKQQQ